MASRGTCGNQGTLASQIQWLRKKSIILTKRRCLLFIVILPLVFSIKETVTIFAMSRATALLSWGRGNSLRSEHIKIEDNWTIAHVLEPPFHRHKNRGTEKLSCLSQLWIPRKWVNIPQITPWLRFWDLFWAFQWTWRPLAYTTSF